MACPFPLPPPAASQPANPRDPELNFEYVWRSIDRTYGQFSVKNVDWDMLYRIYRPQVTAATTDEELWDILVTMLGTLNDAHVCMADGKRRICGGERPIITRDTWAEDFSLDLVKTKYLHGKSSAAREGTYTSGWLTDQIGYLHIADLKDGSEPHAQAIDAFLREFASAQALVIDVRANPGGSGRNHEIVASRFADRRRQYMQSQTRYGPKHDDLWPPEYSAVEPDGPIQFTRPVVLLIHRHTASGPEEFTLAMRVLPHVTVVGDLTEGALSSQFPDRLPNGWTLWVAFKVTRDHEGICWDGLGIPPDLFVLNTPAEIAAGTDRQLEFAQRLLERGAPEPQDEAASLTAVKTSLVDEYARGVRQQQVEAAVAALNRARAAGADTAFFGADEAMQLADQYLGRKQYPAAIGLLQACREDYPEAGRGVRHAGSGLRGRRRRGGRRGGAGAGEVRRAHVPLGGAADRAGAPRGAEGEAGIRRDDLRAGPGRRRDPGGGDRRSRSCTPGGTRGRSSMKPTSTLWAISFCRRATSRAPSTCSRRASSSTRTPGMPTTVSARRCSRPDGRSRRSSATAKSLELNPRNQGAKKILEELRGVSPPAK